jgi:hypothetical protein
LNGVGDYPFHCGRVAGNGGGARGRPVESGGDRGLWAVAPDFDSWLVAPFHVTRGTLFAHRGFFHTPFFLAILAFASAWTVRRGRAWVGMGALWACAAITHPLLDMLTDGGPGVVLLFPFSIERFFFPWRPIRVSPLSILRFFDRAGEFCSRNCRSIRRSDWPGGRFCGCDAARFWRGDGFLPR